MAVILLVFIAQFLNRTGQCSKKLIILILYYLSRCWTVFLNYFNHDYYTQKIRLFMTCNMLFRKYYLFCYLHYLKGICKSI